MSDEAVATDRQIAHRAMADFASQNRDRGLRDEAYAMLVNMHIQREVLARSGRDIGVDGAYDPASRTFAPNVNGLGYGEAIDALARFRGDLKASLPPPPFGPGQPDPDRTYKNYYFRGYVDSYQRFYEPWSIR